MQVFIPTRAFMVILDGSGLPVISARFGHVRPIQPCRRGLVSYLFAPGRTGPEPFLMLARSGPVWSGLIRSGLVRSGLVRYVLVRSRSLVCYDLIWFGSVRYGPLRFGPFRCSHHLQSINVLTKGCRSGPVFCFLKFWMFPGPGHVERRIRSGVYPC